MSVVKISKHDSRVESLARIQRKRVKLQTIACGALLACATLLASSSPAMAQAGKLDSSFGVGGIFTDIANGFFSTGPFTNTQTFATAVAVESNGKIVAGGQIGGSLRNLGNHMKRNSLKHPPQKSCSRICCAPDPQGFERWTNRL